MIEAFLYINYGNVWDTFEQNLSIILKGRGRAKRLGFSLAKKVLSDLDKIILLIKSME